METPAPTAPNIIAAELAILQGTRLVDAHFGMTTRKSLMGLFGMQQDITFFVVLAWNENRCR